MSEEQNIVPPPSSAPVEEPPKKIKAKPATLVIMAFVFTAGVLLILWAWQLWPFAGTVLKTNNSYVRGQMTVLAPQVSGHVTEVLVQDYDRVREGQPIVKIDDRIYRQQLAEAEARLALAHADYDRAVLDLGRVEKLAEQKSVSLRERDQLRATAKIGEAQIKQAEAQRDLAQINLDNTIITAPRDGQLGEASVRLGQYVSAGTQVIFLVPDKVWIIANFKEGQTKDMKIGQRASFTVDALGHARFTGRIEHIAPATGSEFSVLRPDNASGNYTKVVQRLPVRIAIDPDQDIEGRLRPGLSVITSVDTSDEGTR